MAAVTKCKRPWEEEGDVNSDHSATAISRSGRSSISSQHASASKSQYERKSVLETHILPPTRESGQWTSQVKRGQILYNSDVERESEVSEQQYNLQTALPTLSKRQRTDESEIRGSVSADLSIETSGLHQLEGPQTAQDSVGDYYGQKQPTHEPYTTEVSRYGNEARGDQDSAQSANNPHADKSGGQGSCKTCGKLKLLVLQAASIIDVLYDDISNTLAGEMNDRSQKLAPTDAHRPAPHTDLYQSWLWVVDRMHASVQVGKELLVSRHRLFQGNQTAPDDNLKEQDRSFAYTSKIDRLKAEAANPQGRRQSSPHSLDHLRRSDNFRSPSQTSAERRSSYGGEFLSNSSSLQVPHFPNTSRSGQPEYPAQNQSSHRQLPPPACLNFSTSSQLLPPLSPALSEPKSPHTTYLQDLQHQLSTKLLAHQILQGEHEKLLAAYSRSQMRCAALDKKSQISDAEIINLSEDRDMLKIQAEGLEAQVEELHRLRDEAQKESAANSTQYLKIMSMSSVLEAQRAADQKKWKADRETWVKEKGQLLAIINKNNSGSDGIASTTAFKEETSASIGPIGISSTAAGSAPSGQGIRRAPPPEDLASKSVEELCAEILRLRDEKRESIAAWSADTRDLKDAKDALAHLAGIHDRMNKRRAERGPDGDPS